MKKQLVNITIGAILVIVGLSGCNQLINSGVEIKLINNCDTEIHVNLVVSGAAITYTYSDDGYDGKLLGNFSKPPSILKQSGTFIFHQNNTITQEG